MLKHIRPFLTRVSRNRLFHLSALAITLAAVVILAVLVHHSPITHILTHNLPVYVMCLVSAAIFADVLEQSTPARQHH